MKATILKSHHHACWYMYTHHAYTACMQTNDNIYYMNCEMLLKKALYHHAIHSDAKGKVIKLYDSIS